MKKMNLLILILFTYFTSSFSITLQEMFDNAPSSADFDKVIELEFGVTYTGGFEIDGSYDDPLSIQIIGNGAILDMQGERIAFSNMDEELNIQDLIVVNGYIFFNGLETRPHGSVKYVTFYQPKNYAVLLVLCGS